VQQLQLVQQNDFVQFLSDTAIQGQVQQLGMGIGKKVLVRKLQQLK